AIPTAGGTDEDARVRTREVAGRITGVFHSGPEVHHQEPLLGIHTFCFAGRNAEKERIKIAHAGNETTPLDVGLIAFLLGIAIQGAPVPALQGDLADTVLALVQVVPELLQVSGNGKAPAHTDHGHRLRPYRHGYMLYRGGHGVHTCRTGTPPVA